MSNSKRIWSVGRKGTSYFLNEAHSKLTLTRVLFPLNKHTKVAVNQEIGRTLRGMSKKKALNYCKELMQTRKKISMGDREAV